MVYQCPHENCEYETNTKNCFDGHILRKHTPKDKLELHKCNVGDCKKEFKVLEDLKRHQWRVHSIGDHKLHVCDIGECNKTYKSGNELKRHKWITHDIGGEWHECKEPDCDYKGKTEAYLKSHMWQVHDKGNGKWHTCPVEGCDAKFKTAGILCNHKWSVHGISKTRKLHKCDKCDQVLKSKEHLERHLMYVHDEGDFEWHECEEKRCDSRFKTQYDLDKHLWHVHSIGDREMVPCTEDGCTSEFKTNGGLKKHLANIHNLDVTWHDCTHCGKSFKQRGHLNTHLWCVHNVGEEKWYECDDCDKKFKTNGKLKEHRKFVHGDDVTWYPCTHKDCTAKFKTNGHLTRHLSQVHDIGDKQCEFCVGNVNKLNSYTDPKTKEKHNICRACYNKATGHSTSREKQMVETLKKNPLIGPFIILTNQVIKHHMSQTLRRPDVLLSCPNNIHIIIECDECQHSGYVDKCEDGRMDEIIDEFKNGRVIFIRWNPDTYKIEKGKKRKTRPERLKALQQKVIELSQKQYKDTDSFVQVHYMYYDEDNPVITQRFEKYFTY